MTDVFSGAMDRYDWKLVGKKELYVPYNSYKAHSDKTKVDDLIKPGFINPDLLRYGLHRIWVVEATIKPGMRPSIRGAPSTSTRTAGRSGNRPLRQPGSCGASEAPA